MSSRRVRPNRSTAPQLAAGELFARIRSRVPLHADLAKELARQRRRVARQNTAGRPSRER